MSDLSVVITGGLHGIGAEIVERFAQEQCRISIIANVKNVDMDKISELFSQYRKLGSDVRIIPTDIMNESEVQASIEKVATNNNNVIDVVINAALISQQLSYTDTTPKILDTFYKINSKSAYVLMREAYPYLKKSHNPHVLNIAPPINLDPKVMGYRTAYTVTQYLRSMLTVSLANNENWKGIACNSLWPVAPFHEGGNLGIYQQHINTMSGLKSIKLFSEAAYGVVTQPSDLYTGEHFYDEEILDMLGVPLDQFNQNDNNVSQPSYRDDTSRLTEVNYNTISEKSHHNEEALVD
ncbi:MAG: SDR family NAD(P)-dependent oxidoreductase [Pseudomonadota bacterium]|nr:SDR family NAD(P)-dependent oxidoreductase [Pseudomonadota bacterium]